MIGRIRFLEGKWFRLVFSRSYPNASHEEREFPNDGKIKRVEIRRQVDRETQVFGTATGPTSPATGRNDGTLGAVSADNRYPEGPSETRRGRVRLEPQFCDLSGDESIRYVHADASVEVVVALNQAAHLTFGALSEGGPANWISALPARFLAVAANAGTCLTQNGIFIEGVPKKPCTRPKNMFVEDLRAAGVPFSDAFVERPFGCVEK